MNTHSSNDKHSLNRGKTSPAPMENSTRSNAVTTANGVNSNPAKLIPTSPHSHRTQQSTSKSPESKTPEAEEQELNIFVSDLLDQMTNKFEHMGNSILDRIDTMGDRIDNLEKSIGDLMASQGVEGLHRDVGDDTDKGMHNSLNNNDRTAEF